MKSILIIDSSESVRGLVKWTATQSGIAVTDTPKVKEAILYMAIQQYDIILVDAHSAEELLSQLPPRSQVLTIIVMANQDLLVPTLPRPANTTIDYLFKPFDEQTLLFRLEKYRKPVLGTILILDTANIISAPARHMMEATGYTVAILDSDKQLEMALNELQPDIAIIDTSIPPLNRESVVQTLAKHPQIKTLAVIDSRLNPVQVGTYMRQFTDFVPHPINVHELKFRIQRLIKQELPTAPTEKITPVSATAHITSPPPNLPKDRDDRSLLSKVYVTLHHEMRSPLTGILIGAQALSKRVATEEKPVVSEIIESAKRIRDTLDTLAVSNRIRSEEYVNGTQMAKFETPTTPTFHWI